MCSQCATLRKVAACNCCPISGPSVLSKSARERRAREIIAESGADSDEHFNRVVKHEEQGITILRGPDWTITF